MRQPGVAARAASAIVGQAGVMAVQANLQLFRRHIRLRLRVKAVPQLFHVKVNHGQQAEHHQRNKCHQPVADGDIGVILTLIEATAMPTR